MLKQQIVAGPTVSGVAVLFFVFMGLKGSFENKVIFSLPH